MSIITKTTTESQLTDLYARRFASVEHRLRFFNMLTQFSFQPQSGYKMHIRASDLTLAHTRKRD